MPVFDQGGQPLTNLREAVESSEPVTKGQLNASSGAAEVGFIQSGTGAVATDLQSRGRLILYLWDFLTDAQRADVQAGTPSIDISTAWQNAIDAANTQLAAASGHGAPVATGTLIIPAGDYKIDTGASITNCNLKIQGAGVEAVRITIGSGEYLLTVTATIYKFELCGVQTSGGAGVFTHTHTGADVHGHKHFHGNHFADYTVAAISSLSSNCPYWMIHNNQFYAASTTSTKGIVLSGDNSGSVIRENYFLLNKYDIKLAHGGVGINIEHNDFIHFNGTGSNRTRIWIVPHTSSTSSGHGSHITQNKFGNENLISGDYTILVADEGTGTDARDKDHSTSASTGYFNSSEINHNRGSGNSNLDKGFVYSYTKNIFQNSILNYHDGTAFPYILEFDNGLSFTAENRLNNMTNLVGWLHGSTEGSNGLSSNQPSTCRLYDPLNYMVGDPAHINSNPIGHDAGYSVIEAPSILGFTATGSATIGSAETDARGGQLAATCTWVTGGEQIYYSLTLGNITPGQKAWIVVDVKKAASTPLSNLIVSTYESSVSNYGTKRSVTLQAYWQTIILPWNPVQNSNGVVLGFRAGEDFSASTYDSVVIGNVSIYHGQMPVHPGTFPQGIMVGGFTSGTGASLTQQPQRQVSGDAAPTAGTWIVGDICWNDAPSSGNPAGWMCTAAGSPGTWTAMANLA